MCLRPRVMVEYTRVRVLTIVSINQEIPRSLPRLDLRWPCAL